MFRFTIRELVLVMTVVAMGAGWWIDHSRQDRENYEIAAGFHRALKTLQVQHQKDLQDFVANWNRGRTEDHERRDLPEHPIGNPRSELP